MLQNPDIIQCLDEALRLYHIAEERENIKINYNIAKTLYEKVKQILLKANFSEANHSILDRASLAMSQHRKQYYQNKKEEILSSVKDMEDRVKEYERMFNTKEKSIHYTIVNV